MLVVEGLRKAYKQREIVKTFGLTLESGEVVGLLGPNGAGKTTCFYMIVGLVPADAGRIVLDGRDITAEPMYTRAKRGVGYLPQEPSVFRKLSVADNIMLVLELREDLDQAGRKKQLADLMDELQITHVADQAGASLSGGERRRVEIARALAANPRMMLLDEPTQGMGHEDVDRVTELIRRNEEAVWREQAHTASEGDPLTEAIRSLVAAASTSSYVAEMELWAVSRTDPALRDTLRAAEQELGRQRSNLAPEAFEQKRREFEQQVADVQRSVQNRKRVLDQAFNESMKKLHETMLEVVAEVAGEQKASLVLAKQQVVIAEKSLDLTGSVLDRLNKKLPSVAVTVPKS